MPVERDKYDPGRPEVVASLAWRRWSKSSPEVLIEDLPDLSWELDRG